MAFENPPVDTGVTLILPDREMLPGRVDVCTDALLDVSVLAAPRTPLAVWRQATVFLEWVTAEGVCRMTGSVRPLGRAPRHTDQVGVWDVVAFAVGTAPQLLQRREYIRTNVAAAVEVIGDRPGGAALDCRTLTISGWGMRIAGCVGVSEGDELRFRLSSPDGGLPVHGRCRVVEIGDDGAAATRFTAIDPGDRHRLVSYAYERELAARGRRLAA